MLDKLSDAIKATAGFVESAVRCGLPVAAGAGAGVLTARQRGPRVGFATGAAVTAVGATLTGCAGETARRFGQGAGEIVSGGGRGFGEGLASGASQGAGLSPAVVLLALAALGAVLVSR